MKTTEKIRLSGSIFATAQKCPASLTIEFSKKLMSEEGYASDGTDAHEEIAADIESVRRFLPPKSKDLVEYNATPRIEHMYGIFNVSGETDWHGVDYKKGVLYVYDWKTGPMGIEALGEHQVEFYAFLILRSLTKSQLKQLHTVELALVAPGLNQKKTFTRSVSELMESVETKLDAIETAIKKKEKPKPGSHCRFCSKRFVCVELRDELKRFAEPRFQGNLLKTVTAADLKTLAVASAVIADIRKYVAELIENGSPVPGVSIQYQNAARVFDETVDVRMLAEKLGAEPEQLVKSKMLTPAQLEKAGFDLAPVDEFVTLTKRKVLKVEAPTAQKKPVTKKTKVTK